MAINYEAIFGVDEYDPCAALRALRPAYMRMVAGGGVEKINFRDRETWFQRSDLEAFGALITQLEGDCAEKSGRGPRRFAIRAGSRARPLSTDPFEA